MQLIAEYCKSCWHHSRCDEIMDLFKKKKLQGTYKHIVLNTACLHVRMCVC